MFLINQWKSFTVCMFSTHFFERYLSIETILPLFNVTIQEWFVLKSYDDTNMVIRYFVKKNEIGISKYFGPIEA